jgi:hypothetical protein
MVDGATDEFGKGCGVANYCDSWVYALEGPIVGGYALIEKK